MNPSEILKLEYTALNIRRHILRLIRAGEAGHVGGALSTVEIVTALYFNLMKIDPANPKWPQRDRFVLSAGHKLPGVETNTGALGHGLSISGGMALGLRLDKFQSRVFVLMGDGELAEGSNWEAASAASMHKIENLIVFVDRNKLQISGPTIEVMNYEPLDERWRSFGWGVRTIDGHNLESIISNVNQTPFEKGKPSVIIADTVKSKGLSFAEGKVSYHYWKSKPEEMEQAERDLDKIEEHLKSKMGKIDI